jgi:hypothetical protein
MLDTTSSAITVNASKLASNKMSTLAVLPDVKTCCKSGITVGMVYHSTPVPVLVSTCPAVPTESKESYNPPKICVSPVK